MFKILKKLYSLFWVPVFGRILSLFIRLIEGREPSIKPTFQIDNINNMDKNND